MPVIPESLFLEGLRELIRLDQAWIPPADVGALYIRPILFSVDPSIRVKPADRCQFIIFTFPFGAYFSDPVDVVVCKAMYEHFREVQATQSPQATTPPGSSQTRRCGKLGSLQ